MKTILTAVVCIASLSCKPSYSYEGQSRAGDQYHVEWISKGGKVATCFVIEGPSSTYTISTDGIVVNTTTFSPEGRSLVISDASGVVLESPGIQDFIYYCSPGGYKKIRRSKAISDLIREDYRVMDYKLIDHLVSEKLIP